MENNKIPEFVSAEEYEAEIKENEKSVNKTFSSNNKLSKEANELLLKLGRNPNDYEPADYL